MKKEILTAILLFLLPVSQFLKAQGDSLNKNFIRVNSITLGLGPNLNQPGYVSIDTYKKLAPGDSLVNCDLTLFKGTKGRTDVGTCFNTVFGFQHFNKKTGHYYTQREHRLGFRFYATDLLKLRYDRNSKATVDSLNYKGKDYYNVEVDSSIYFLFSVQRRNMMMEFGTVYLSSPTRLTVGYAGYNIGVGFSYNSNVHAEYTQNIHYKDKKHFNENVFGNYKVENTILNNSILGYASLNWGVNFRFAKIKRFWSKLIFNVEFRTGLAAEYIERYGPYVRANFGGQFGFKFLL